MIEAIIAIYIFFIGLSISISAKTRMRFLIGVELQVLGIILLMLQYASMAPALATLVILSIALEALKMGVAIGLK
jgi:uncharacterized membrane protein